MRTRPRPPTPEPSPGEEPGSPPGAATAVRPKPPLRLTPLGIFAAAVMFLLASVAAVVAGQLTAKGMGPLLSLAYSAGAVICTILALVVGRRR